MRWKVCYELHDKTPQQKGYELENEQIEQARKLLQATKDILTKCDDGIYVKNVMEVTAVWDEAECDGNCLLEEITILLEEIED